MAAITVEDLDNAKLDVDHIAEIATSLQDSATDRMGHTKLTMTGVIDKLTFFNFRGNWATATAYALKDVFTDGVLTYVATRPHTSTTIAADLAAGNIALYQGVTTQTVDQLQSGVDFTPGGNTLTLSRNPGSKNNLQIHLGGSFLGPEFYSLSGNVVTTTFALPADVPVIYATIGILQSTVSPGAGSITDETVSTDAAIDAKKLSYNLGVTGSVPDSIYGTMRNEVSLWNFMSNAQRNDLMAGGWSVDITAAMQAAIDYASANHKELHIPSGNGPYLVIPATTVTSEAGTETAAFIMRSNLHIVAEAGATFKLADNQSTDSTPKSLEMFFTNQVLSNVSFRGLAMDMNGANNPISPGRPTTYDVGKNMAMICVSGTPGGVAARIDDMVIEDCVFMNTSGVCCVLAAQSNSVGVRLGQRWTMRGNLFLNNGTDTADHTSVFAWANEFLTEGNVFWQSNPYGAVGRAGGLTAFEVHGSNHRFVNNYVQNYFRGMWVGPTYTDILENTTIANNTFNVNWVGIDFFRSTAAQTTSRKTLIHGNTFNLDDSTYSGPPGTVPTQKIVINLACPYGVADVTISDNQALKVGTSISSAFCSISPGTVAGQTFDRITLKDNKAKGFAFGLTARSNTTNGIGHIEVKDNEFLDFDGAGVSPTAFGVFVDGSTTGVSTLILDGNTYADSAGSGGYDYGVYLQGAIGSLMLGAQFYKGMTQGRYAEASATITDKQGFAPDFPYVPTVMAGASTVSIGDGSITCSYSLLGDMVVVDMRMVVGSTTSFGGGGSLTVGMPFTAKGAGHTYLGNWRIFDGSSIFKQGVAGIDGTGNVVAMTVDGAGQVSNSAPVSLTTGRTLTMQIMYRKA